MTKPESRCSGGSEENSELPDLMGWEAIALWDSSPRHTHTLQVISNPNLTIADTAS